MKCSVCDCSSEAEPGGNYCRAHALLFEVQDRTASTALLAAIEQWVIVKYATYPEERRRHGSGLWISPEEIRRLCKAAGAVDFASAQGAHGLFVRELRRQVKALYKV